MSDEATVTQPEVAEAVNTAGAAVGEAVAANGAENGDSEAPAPAETETAAANTEDAVTTKTKEGEQPVGMLQTTARGDPKNYSANVKSDPSLLPESDDPGEIRKQVSHPASVRRRTTANGRQGRVLPQRQQPAHG